MVLVGPTNTTGRSFSGIRSSRPYISLRPFGILMPRRPKSVDSTRGSASGEYHRVLSSCVAPTARLMISRASSLNLVVCSPVPEVSVWVFA